MNFFQTNNDKPVYIPLIDLKVPGGLASPFIDYVAENIDIAKQLAPNPISTSNCFCKGDSMIDACILAKTLLVVDKSVEAQISDIVNAYVNGGFTVKYIKFDEGKCFLIPANKKKRYPVIEVTEDLEMVLWGVVINVVIYAKNLKF